MYCIINDYLIIITYSVSDFNDINGINHQCGSGPKIIRFMLEINMQDTVSGSGYAFGMVLVLGGYCRSYRSFYDNYVDSPYPMRGSNGVKTGSDFYSSGGVGNQTGINTGAGYSGEFV